MAEILKAIPCTVLIDSTSFLPQYWAASIINPEEVPVATIININWMFPANEDAAIAVCPTKPSIITSAELTAAAIRFWIAIGPTTLINDL